MKSEKQRIEREIDEQNRRLEAVQAAENEITDKMKMFNLSGETFYSPDGYMIGEGYTGMTAEDVADAKTVDLVMNMNETIRDQYPPGIGYIKISGKVVVAKHGVTGQMEIVVLGIRDPKCLPGSAELLAFPFTG